MDLMILKKKIDGYRLSNGSIRSLPTELLFELRQNWENFTGSKEEFRSQLGMKAATLSRLLVESKKLNHLIGSTEGMGIPDPIEAPSEGSRNSQSNGDLSLELVFDQGNKIIRFPSVDLLIDFLRKAA